MASLMPADSSLLSRNDAGATLSPFLGALLQLRRLTAPRNAAELTPAAIRQRFHDEVVGMRVGFPVRESRDLAIPSSSGTLAARYYRPLGEAEPVLLLYFHGGGFIFGDLDTHDDACRLLCHHSGMGVLAVAYRLAPEHPFPAALDDADAAVRWAQNNLASLDAKSMAVGGDSAGANLAAVTAQALAGTAHQPLAQLLIYPGTDRITKRPSHELFGSGYFLDSGEREMFYRHYLAGGRADASDPRVSPLLAPQRKGAAALVVTAGFDMVRDEGRGYADHLEAAGTPTRRLHFDRLGHGFINLAGIHSESKAALTRIAREWRQLCVQQFQQGEVL